jgi:hypothetical protein
MTAAQDDELPFTIGVVVTVTVNAIDYGDAASIAELAVKQALLAAGERDMAVTVLTATARDGRTWPVQAQRVESIDRLFRSGHGYVTVLPPRRPDGAE